MGNDYANGIFKLIMCHNGIFNQGNTIKLTQVMTQSQIGHVLIIMYVYGMKALIICHDFPPLNSIGAQRPFHWFKNLKKYGIEPTVVTKNWPKQASTVSEVFKTDGMGETVIENLPEGKIIRVPIEHIIPERMIARYGINKYVLIRKSLTFLYKTLAHVFFVFDRNALMYKAAKAELKKEKYDIIITTGEPWIVFKYAYLLKKEFGICWITDYRDGWFINQEHAMRTGFFHQLMRHYEYYFEKKYTSLADLVITVDPFMAEKLHAAINKPVKIIYNGFEKFISSPFEGGRGMLPTVQKSKTLTIVHTGTIKNTQNVEFLLRSIKTLHKDGKIKPGDLKVIFLALEYEQVQLNRVINFDASIRPYLETTPRLPKEKAMEVNASADYGITFSDPNWSAIYAKTYDYVATKTPILVIPSDNRLLDNFIKELNFGHSFTTENELQEFICQAIKNKKEGKKMGNHELNVEKALFYTRENQTKELANIIKSTCAA